MSVHGDQAMASNPKANNARTREPLLRLQGRLDRVRFLTAFSFVFLVLVLLSSLNTAAYGTLNNEAYRVVFAFTCLLGLALYTPLAVRRLNDINLRGWWALVLLVPVVGAFVPAYLIGTPGSDGPNRYGAAPPPRGKAVTTVCIVLVVTVVVLSVFAVIIGRILSQAVPLS